MSIPKHETETELEIKHEPEFEFEVELVPKPEPEFELEVELVPKPEPEYEVELEPKPEAELEPELEPKPEAELEPEPEAELEPKPEAELEPEPSTSSVADEEYQIQHFGFGAQRFKKEMRDMIHDKIRTGIKRMEQSVTKIAELNETEKIEFEQSCDKLAHLWIERSMPFLDIIDAEIDTMFAIPSSVLLPEDESQLEQVTEEDYERLKEEVYSLRRELLRQALLEQMLIAKQKELKSAAVIDAHRRLLEDMKTLDAIQKHLDKSETQTESINKDMDFIQANFPITETEEEKEEEE